MSYTRNRRDQRARALAGIQSLPPGRDVSRRAFGDIIEYGTMIGATTVPSSVQRSPTFRSGAPRWYSAMQGTSLGSDEDQSRTANALQNIHLALEGAIKTAEKQKWLQLAATLSIPLAAYIWKWLLKRRGSATEGIT